MKKVTNGAVGTGPPLTVGRTGLAAFLLALLRPGAAKGATLHSHDVTLDLLSKSLSISFDQIEKIDVKKGWFGHSVRIRLADAEKTVSGLTQRHARALADELEAARVYWWQKTLEAQKAPLQSVHAGISRLANPMEYTRFSVFSRLEKDAARVVTHFPMRCPDQLSASDEVRKLEAIRAFVQDPGGHRTRANVSFVNEEMERSRSFFDSIEARPLTDEQRKAVVVDEDHNLVVAAAGSGKVVREQSLMS